MAYSLFEIETGDSSRNLFILDGKQGRLGSWLRVRRSSRVPLCLGLFISGFAADLALTRPLRRATYVLILEFSSSCQAARSSEARRRMAEPSESSSLAFGSWDSFRRNPCLLQFRKHLASCFRVTEKRRATNPDKPPSQSLQDSLAFHVFGQLLKG